jgi:deazaflavin-dependent oxidoreductase (nitroreductase family)
MSNKISPEMAVKLRQGFKYLNKYMLTMWRLGMGHWFNLWPEGWGQVMVITHTGRVTGKTHRTPVNFAILDGDIYCIAGFGQITDWYRNILINKEVEVWLPDGWWKGVAEDQSQSDDRPRIMRAVIIASGFVAPLFGIDPKELDDEALARISCSYKVVRIRRVSPKTGPGGPGDLSWVWQVATFILLPLVFIRRKKRTKR